GSSTLAPYTPIVPENPDMLALLAPFQTYGQLKLGVSIGETDAKLEGDRPAMRSRPTSMGVLVGLASMEKTGADFAVVNAGSVRDSLPVGKISYKDVLKVFPFGNTLVTVDLSGTEVMAYLNTVAKMTVGSGAFPQFAGVQLDITAGVVTRALIRNTPLDPVKNYRLVVNNFQAVGGDGYPVLTGHKSFLDSGYVDADVLREYIADHTPLKSTLFAPGEAVVRR
ncbi:MAG: 5'-nucleotidase C-terminal domain-containing protein, partial [Rhodoferax sp.]|uniref:5'-nucleotidase C-terminal domain-containing protein n=1 Tax=Rhodoferax sp. TaxID=50421 RepID=UPI0030196541